MFNTGKTDFPLGKYKKLIDESNTDTPNITIEWETGLLVNDEFRSFGVSSACYVGDTYNDLISALPSMVGIGYVDAIETWLGNNTDYVYPEQIV